MTPLVLLAMGSSELICAYVGSNVRLSRTFQDRSARAAQNAARQIELISAAIALTRCCTFVFFCNAQCLSPCSLLMLPCPRRFEQAPLSESILVTLRALRPSTGRHEQHGEHQVRTGRSSRPPAPACLK